MGCENDFFPYQEFLHVESFENCKISVKDRNLKIEALYRAVTRHHRIPHHPPRFQPAIVQHGNLDFISLPERPHTVIVDLTDMSEPVVSKVPAQELVKPDGLLQKRDLVLLCLLCQCDTICDRNLVVVRSVFVQPADLPPVDYAVIIRFAVEHVRVDPADREPVIINSASCPL